MRNSHRYVSAFVAALGMLVAPGPAEGALITNVIGVSGPGLGTSDTSFPLLTVVPNNDDTIASLNFWLYEIVYPQTDFVDVQFEVRDSSGTTEYTFVGTNRNRTPDIWRAIRLELGFGVGDAFTRSGFDGLSFDTDELDPTAERNDLFNSTNFILLDHGDNVLLWTEGRAFPISIEDQLLAIDVPDSPGVPASARTADGYRFTLRHTPLLTVPGPIVPEPHTFITMSIALAIICRRRRTPAAWRCSSATH